MLIPSVGSISSLFLTTIQESGIHKEEFTLFDTSRVWVFDSIFLFNIIWVYIPRKNLPTQAKPPEYQYGLEWYQPKEYLRYSKVLSP